MVIIKNKYFLIIENIKHINLKNIKIRNKFFIIYRNNKNPKYQVAFLALDKYGNSGSSCLQEGFSYYRYKNNTNKNLKVKPI